MQLWRVVNIYYTNSLSRLLNWFQPKQDNSRACDKQKNRTISGDGFPFHPKYFTQKTVCTFTWCIIVDYTYPRIIAFPKIKRSHWNVSSGPSVLFVCALCHHRVLSAYLPFTCVLRYARVSLFVSALLMFLGIIHSSFIIQMRLGNEAFSFYPNFSTNNILVKKCF